MAFAFPDSIDLDMAYPHAKICEQVGGHYIWTQVTWFHNSHWDPAN